jgi:hypothetical protein
MTVGELLDQIRYMINDRDKLEYTDNELINYLNQAQDYIANTCINHQYKGFLKTTTLTLTDGVATLPDDFVVESALYAGDPPRNLLPIAPGTPIEANSYVYRITGNQLESDQDTITLVYYSYPQQYFNTTDTINLPPQFINLLREITVFLALNRNEFNTSVEQQLSVLYEQKLLKLISNYGLATVPLNLPFWV